jgi:cbb3-type cytochrome oxidase subunit 3
MSDLHAAGVIVVAVLAVVSVACWLFAYGPGGDE